MNLFDEIFQIYEVITKGDTPIKGFKRELCEVPCFNVTIHTNFMEKIYVICSNTVMGLVIPATKNVSHI